MDKLPPEGDGLAEEAASNEVASKMFPPEMEDELWKAIEQQGFTVQPEVKMAKKIPPWGYVSAEGGIAEIRALPRPQFGRPQSLNLLIKPERVLKARKRALPKSGLVQKPMRIRRFGTLRCYSATFQRSTALGKRGCRDMGNAIYYSTKCKATMKRNGLSRGKYVAPKLGEWMMGLPANWTSSRHTADADPAPQDPGRFVNTSLFSGVGGIELGTHAAFATTIYVECNEEAKAVLEKRISDAHLHEGVFVNKVEDLTEADLQYTESITAGFPCPDISNSGKRSGFKGSRSSLFRFVVKAILKAGMRCRVVMLENVNHIVSEDMADVMKEVVTFLVALEFTEIKWGVVSAADVGSPQMRKRWFLIAWRAAADKEKLQRLVPKMATQEVKGLAKRPWNAKHAVKMEDWMEHDLAASEKQRLKQRLKQLGNCVVPMCAKVALSVLVHS